MSAKFTRSGNLVTKLATLMWMSLLLLMFSVFLLFFCVFPKRVLKNPRGVVQPFEQKLRQPFLLKLKKLIVFAIKFALIWRSFCLWRGLHFCQY